MLAFMPYLHFFSALSDTITAFAISGGYVTLFLVLLFEGIPLIGIAIPGHVALISAGFLVATHVFGGTTTFIVTIAGAIVGDYVSYLLGKKFGWAFIERLLPYFFISDSIIQKAKKFLETHTGKALVLGRFNPVTRGLMPFIVGSNHLPTKHFFLWNSIGAVIWVLSSLAIGYALGLGFHVVTGWVSRAVVVGIIFILLMMWAYKFVNVRFHIFRKFELFVLSMNIFSILVLARMTDDAFQVHPFMAAFDLYINQFVAFIMETPWGDVMTSLALWISGLGGIASLTVLTVLGGVYLAKKGRWRSVAILLMSMGTTAFTVGWAKDVFARVRPENLVTPEVVKSISLFFDRPTIVLDPSFPSGHAAFAAAFFTILAYLLVPRISGWIKRELFIVGCFLAVLLIGLSRIALNVHWASDVIAGWALGVFCATISILFVRYVGALFVKRII